MNAASSDIQGLRRVESSAGGRAAIWAARARRISRSKLTGLLFGALALTVLCFVHGHLPKLAMPPRPTGWLVALTVMAIGVSYLAAALSVRAASGRPLPWGRTVLVQLAGALANRLIPAGLGGITVNLRYLQKSGMPPPAAGVAVGLVACANGLATLIVGAAVAPFAASSFHPGHFVVLAAGCAGALALTGIATMALRRKIPSWLRRHLVDLSQAVTALRSDPKRVALVVVGSLGVKVAHIAALLAALAAFDSDLQLPVIAAVYLAGNAAGSAVPTPSGLGGVDAALVSGLLAAGAPLAIVIGGVIVFRLASFWMPIIPGMAATWVLRRQHAV